ncbi:MAG: prepilin-type N-terminal cleavage/methylation domain-containing protein [Phycisphaerales bacterium]|nr:prepilin-type N-terminal cleavage/methylation domain-containing protein [Phycisphaerales bacterium]
MCARPDNPLRRAFTLLELCIVVAVMGVLAAVAVPRISQAADRYRAQSALARLDSDLQRAMATARAQGKTIVFALDAETSTYRFTGLSNPHTGESNTTINLGVQPFRTPVVGSVLPLSGSVSFLPTGLPDESFAVTIVSGTTIRTLSFDARTAISTLSARPVISAASLNNLAPERYVYIETTQTKINASAIQRAADAAAAQDIKK